MNELTIEQRDTLSKLGVVLRSGHQACNLGDLLELIPGTIYKDMESGCVDRTKFCAGCTAYNFTLTKIGPYRNREVWWYGYMSQDSLVMISGTADTALKAAYEIICWSARNKLLNPL